MGVCFPLRLNQCLFLMICCGTISFRRGLQFNSKLFAKMSETKFSLKKKPISIVLSGSTSTGKSSVAEIYCKSSGQGEIVACDSVQVYRRLDIGSNKPTASDQETIPHHLIDIKDASQTMTSAEFALCAAEAVNDILTRNKTPVIVGGSTMWLQWLLHGIPDAPKPSPEVTERSTDIIEKYKELRDWEAAKSSIYGMIGFSDRIEKIPRNDWYRLHRYLEIELSLREKSSATGAAVSLVNSRTPVLPSDLDIRSFFLTEDREELSNIIDTRCEQMLELGLIDEVGKLVYDGVLTASLPVSKSIGYRQAIDCLCEQPATADEERAVFDDFVRSFASDTRSYARRQVIWHRRDRSFMFLKMQRPVQVEGKGYGESYMRVCEELAHWCSVDRAEYEEALRHQLRSCEAYNKFLAMEKVSPSLVPADELERGVLSSLLKSKTVRLGPTNAASLPEGAIGATYRENAAVSLPIDASQWTAYDGRMRASKDPDKQKKMRRFHSQLEAKGVRNAELFMQQMALWRKKLWEERSEAMQLFATEKQKSDSAVAEDS